MSDSMSFQEKLYVLGACEPALDWVGTKTIEEAWNTCTNSDWMVWLVFELNHWYRFNMPIASALKDAFDKCVKPNGTIAKADAIRRFIPLSLIVDAWNRIKDWDFGPVVLGHLCPMVEETTEPVPTTEEVLETFAKPPSAPSTFTAFKDIIGIGASPTRTIIFEDVQKAFNRTLIVPAEAYDEFKRLNPPGITDLLFPEHSHDSTPEPPTCTLTIGGAQYQASDWDVTHKRGATTVHAVCYPLEYQEHVDVTGTIDSTQPNPPTTSTVKKV